MARFSDYAIQGELARGNMGVVFRAYDAVRGCDVALKRLHRAGSAIDAQRFGVEVAAARRLRHPHVVGIHAAGADEAGLWLVMDLVEGESLFERLQRGPLDWEQARRIGLQLADALAHAHAHGVLHRDVKPHNVLLDARGDAHLADFGLARLVGDDVRLTQEGDVLGTPIYMAPEQALAQRDRVGERTDVYGLGATLFHALTATPPFYAEQIDLLLQQVVHDAPRAPSSLVPGIPPSLDAVVLRCLAKPPAARYASAEDLGEALRLLGPA
ncbi:MAG: serine/threonine protein kinase, partial [Planctomycetes bacterium]|nr:serine/threonine protein kinase [Planctomycetota bacterium]